MLDDINALASTKHTDVLTNILMYLYILDFFSNLSDLWLLYLLVSFFLHTFPAAMSRVHATTDYLGPDCRYLNFKTGEEIMVYSKLSRKNENLWIGSVSTSI